MVKSRVQPRGRVVTLIASLRKVRGNVTGIRRTLIILQVTGHACGGGDVVVVVDVTVATLTRRHHVPSRERETRAAVVEGGILP